MSSFAKDSKGNSSTDAVAEDSEGKASTNAIATLLVEHAAEIQKLKELVAASIPPSQTDGIYCKYDDLFFLRYVLSFRTAAKAKEAVLACFTFRAQPRWQHLIQQIKDDTYKSNDFVQEMEKWQVAAPVEGITVSGGFCVVIRGGMSDQATMIDRVPKHDMYTANMAYREMAFQKCDAVTRSTGLLAKQVLFFDMKGSKLSDMMDRRMADMYADISKVAADVYPQMQEKTCLMNAPRWMGWVMAVFTKMLPTRTMEKFEMYTSTEQMWNSEWAQDRLVRDQAPEFMGGRLNETHMPVQLTGKMRVYAPSPEITVPARSVEIISVQVPIAGAEIHYNLMVVARGIKCSAIFVEGQGQGSECSVPKHSTAPPQTLREESKLKADDGAEKGVWCVDSPGVLQITLDNTYSMLRTKTVKYTVEVKGLQETKN